MDVETRPAIASTGSATMPFVAPSEVVRSRTTSNRSATTAGIWHWSLALVDQALVSGTRFLVTIIVGRFCGPGELGTYSLAFSLLILAGCFQEAIITTPYAVLSQRLRRLSRASYAGAIAWMHFLAAIGCMVVLAALAMVGFALHINTPATIALVLALTLPASLAAEFARRFALAHLDVRRATCLDAAIALLQLITLLLLAQAEWLSARVALLAIGAACLLPALVWWTLFARSRMLTVRATAPYWGRNWSLGRWLAASQVMAAIHGLMPTWLLAMTVDAGAAGEFVACLNLALLANPLILAVGNLLTPRAAQAMASGGPAAVQHVVFQVQRYLVALMAIFALALTLGGHRLVQWIYGESFAGSAGTAGLLGLTAIMWAVSATCASGLTALARPRWAFVASCTGTVVSAFCIALLTPVWTVFGASLGLLMGGGTAAAIHTWALIRFSSSSHPERLPQTQPTYDHWLAPQEPTNA